MQHASAAYWPEYMRVAVGGEDYALRKAVNLHRQRLGLAEPMTSKFDLKQMRGIWHTHHVTI